MVVGAQASPGLLTERQRELARLLAGGKTNRQIAAELGLSQGTVANYVRRLLRGLGLSSRGQVAVWAVEHGLTGTQDRLLSLLERLLAIESPDLHTALAAAADLIAETLQADKVDAFLLEPSAETLVAVGVSHTPMARKQKAIGMDRLALANGGRVVEVFRTGVAFHDGRAELDPAELPGVKDALGVRSVINTPLEIGGQRRGVLSVVTASPDHFTERDVRLLESVSRWTGLIAHRAELVTQLTDTAAQRGRRQGAEELIAVLAHDMRNHLTPMQGRIDLLRHSARRDEREADLRHIDLLESSVVRLHRLLADLLDTSRLEHGLFSLSVRSVDLVALAREAASTLERLEASIDLHVPDELWLTAADPDRLRQAIENLLTNGIQHAAAGTAVLLEINSEQRDTATWAVLAVTNIGPAIPGEMMSRLFERFSTGPGSTGLGLGLYLARGIAAAHGGTLEANTASGLGATFRLALPVER